MGEEGEQGGGIECVYGTNASDNHTVKCEGVIPP